MYNYNITNKEIVLFNDIVGGKVMSKILVITEEPNKQASVLSHKELFDINKNAFSQFVGRLVFGCEIDYRKYFNYNYITWMHSLGSKCHGDTYNDGRDAIRNNIESNNYEMIIILGRHASKVLLSNHEACIRNMAFIMKNGPIELKKINGEHIRYFNTTNPMIAFLPHPSGQAQKYWMKYSNVFSDCLIKVQEIVKQICIKD